MSAVGALQFPSWPWSREDATPLSYPVASSGIQIRSIQDDRVTPAPIGHAIWLTMLDFSGLTSIIKQIVTLQTGAKEDDYGILQPSPHAFDATLETLVWAANVRIQTAVAERMEGSIQGSKAPKTVVIPRGSVTTDEEGGLRIEWKRGGQAIRLIVSASPAGQSYVYFETGPKYYGTDKVSGSVLAHRLKLLD